MWITVPGLTGISWSYLCEQLCLFVELVAGLAVELTEEVEVGEPDRKPD